MKLSKSGFITLILSISAIVMLIISNAPKYSAEKMRVGICKAADHIALDQVVAGIESRLSQNKDIEVSVTSCQGNTVTAEQIISKLSTDCRVIITIGTMPSIIASNMSRHKDYECAKVVFSSVTNPDDIPNKDKVTGVSNFIALDPQIAFFKKLQPKLQKLGIIYNAAEQNSVAIVHKIDTYCKKESNITLIAKCASNVQEIQQVTNSLIQDGVDAVFISNDNTALSSLPLITSLCKKYKIPVYVSDTDQVEPSGCLASLGPNQYDIGVQTAEIAVGLIDGKPPPIEYPQSQKTVINVSVAKELGIEIPEELRGAELVGDNE
ncbi:MAG: ABC transporter substrate-binding protein [Holosporales bacterium]|jgi:putative ABC transport system substrate-binding protein|nr:ABC transporter substrate-binding protein [Holosporales bacterium]